MTLYEIFDRAASRHPTRIALEIPPGPRRAVRSTCTYTDLAAHAQAIARALQSRVHREVIVAIVLPRASIRAYAAMLGILRAGAAYTAIDLSVPDERVRVLLDDAQPAAILTDAAGAARLASLGVSSALILDLDEAIAEAPPDSLDVFPAWLAPDTLAYVIYTSGTTGAPKGVMVEHRAIVNLVQSDVGHFSLSADARVGQGSSLAYDSSIEEIWLAWAVGATVVVIDDDVVRSGPDLVPWLEQERVSVLCPPPTLLRTMGRADAAARLKDIALIYVGGEALTHDVVNVWAPGRRLVNGYGPTECAVTSLRADAHAGDAAIAVGWPVTGLHAVVLDASLAPVADGERGELCFAGVGLARGYWRAPELTRVRFPQHPTFGRIYRTGDLAHRGADGALFCHGRLDAQVKIRGHRIELEEIDAHLSRCAGIQAAACVVVADGARQSLVAFAVPMTSMPRPSFEDLRTELSRLVPAHGVPSEFHWVPVLPRTTGGKIDRTALRRPSQAPDETGTHRIDAQAEDEVERLVLRAVRGVLGRATRVAADQNLFTDLGGDSVAAAEIVTTLRESPQTRAITVRDVYESATLRHLVARARAAAPDVPRAATVATPREGRPGLATAIQTLMIAFEAWWMCVAAYAIGAWAGTWMLGHVGLGALIIMAPVAIAIATPLYAAVTVVIAVLTKRALIGRYTTMRAPVWGSFYVRHWAVQRAARRIPWWLITGTELHAVVLRALGAHIGRRVHIHRGVDLRQGGWDLLHLDDDVSLGQDAELRLVDLDHGHLVIGPIALGAGATLEVRAGVGAHTRVGAGAYLTALSDLPEGGVIPAGERWDGLPAQRVGEAPAVPERSRLGAEPTSARVWRWSCALVLAQLATMIVAALPAAAIVSILLHDAGAAPVEVITVLVAGLLPGPATVVWIAVMARTLGRAREGVIGRWDLPYVRVWIKTGLLNAANEWLSGTLMWPWWLRGAGMAVGPDCEVSTIIDVVPELVTIGPGSFLADGNYLGGPTVHRGTVRLSSTVLGAGVFVGNHAVIPGGTRVADGVLLGVSTVAGSEVGESGRSWFGHPPFALPRRSRAADDAHVTHHPSGIRYFNRLFWECLRFAIPVVPLVAVVWWARGLTVLEASVDPVTFLTIIVPAMTWLVALGVCVFVLMLKWGLLGRVRPGEHALWSCWCSRWDFLYVCWGQIAFPFLSAFDGTLLLPWYLRAMGAEIGRRVVLGSGFAQLVDPDMLHIGDDATVQAQLQAHTFEDRVLKVDHVRIGARANVGSGVVLLYGADVGEDASVGSHSVVMKHERLTAGRSYSGSPIQELRS